MANAWRVAPAVFLLSACQTLPSDPHDLAASATTGNVSAPTEVSLSVDDAQATVDEPRGDVTNDQPGLAPPAEAQQPNDQTLAAANELDQQVVVREIQQEAEAALAAPPANNAWDRLQNGMSMQPVSNARVEAQINWFLKNPGYLERVMRRAEPVLPFILDEIEARGLPTELALLPIVESAYQAFAYSHGRASGMWQIIPSTAHFLGLKLNWWYDGRRDIIESTRAALNYLESLAGQFDQDWELALASYNAGPGRVRSAVRYNNKKGRPTDFWHLTQLRRETLDYVPKMMALKELFSDPDKYGLELKHIEDEHGYAIVDLDSQIDLAVAARLAQISTDDLYQLNPAFNRWATPPGGPHRLLLPLDKLETFNQGLAKLDDDQRVNWIRYKIRQGDSLSVIASRFNTTTQLIKKVNKLSGNRIRAGKHLLIPTATSSLDDYSLSEDARKQALLSKKRDGQKLTHPVLKGESLWTISRRYGVGTRELAAWNAMAPGDTLKIGQKLVVWQKTKSSSKVQPVSLLEQSGPRNRVHALRYTVRKGDSLSRIAQKFNIRVADIRKWNELGKYLHPGQKLKLFVDITSQSG